MELTATFLRVTTAFVALSCASACMAASFNCTAAQSPREKLVCSNAELSSLDDKVANAYKTQLEPLGEAEAALVRQDQRDWLPWLDKVCPPHNNRGDDPARCLINHYNDRLQQLSAASPPINGYRVYTRAHFVYVPGHADPDSNSNPGFGQGQFAWPQIDRPTSAQQAWNDAVYKATVAGCGMEQAPKNFDEAVDTVSTIEATFNIHAANAHFIDVDLGVSDYEGGAHGMYSSTSFAWMFDPNRPLKTDDIFDPGSGWQKKLATLTLTKLLKDPGPDALWKPGPYTAPDALQKGVEDGVVHPSAWDLSSQGLTITFGSYAIGPYSSGMPSATFTWQELRPLLAHSFLPEQLPAPLPTPASN